VPPRSKSIHKGLKVMEVLLITGFLGAGKTTLIRHLLSSEFSAEAKVAVIVNEVGEIGIDGAVIDRQEGRDVDVMELTSGCICCTIKTDFFKAVQEIHKTLKPSHLIVEATGIAQPGDMFDILCQAPVSEFSRLKSVVTVVDAGFFEAREVLGTFYDNQIKCADILILNKIDQVDSDRLEQIMTVLADLNAQSHILSAQHCAVDTDMLLGLSARQQDRTPGNHLFHHHAQGGFNSFTFEDRRLMDKQKLDRFLDALPPNLFRCKGWVRFVDGSKLLNYIGGNYRYEPDDGEHDTTLVFVGRNCDEIEIIRAIEDCLI
jgi:G3E family GTPase